MASEAVQRMTESGLIGAVTTTPERTTLCSCGRAKAHVIATRQTADEQSVSVWSDGSITTGRLGCYVAGLGAPSSLRSNWARSARVRAVRLVMDDVSLWTLAELPRVVKIAAATYAHSYSNESARRAHVRALAHRALSEAA